MKKIIISTMLVFTMVMSLIPHMTQIAQAEIFKFGDFEYETNGYEAVITKYNGNAATIEIPATINGKPVSVIAGEAFKDCTSITNVKIPNSVYYIGIYAFAGCTSLASITIPDSVTTISWHAFAECTNLENVILGNGIDALSPGIFRGCKNLKSIIIPNSVIHIHWQAFATCENLANVTFGNKVESIGDNAFSDSPSLTEIIFPDSLITLGNDVFHACTSLKNITFGKNLEYIGISAFARTNLKNVKIPASLTSLASSAFIYCENLTSVIFEGNAPVIQGDIQLFDSSAPGFTVYYYEGATGWTNPWNGHPTVMLSSLLLNFEEYIDKMTTAEKESIDAVSQLILYAEEEILKVATQTVSGGDIAVNMNAIKNLQDKANDTKKSIEQTLDANNIDIIREIRTGIRFETSQTKKVVVNLDLSLANMEVNNIEIKTPGYSLSIPKNTVLADISSKNLVVTIEETGSGTAFAGLDSKANLKSYAADTSKQVPFKITLSDDDIKKYVVFSFDPLPGDTTYQAVQRSDGTYIGGKYNPATKKIDARIKKSGTYTVKENKKDFSDIADKNKDMREAITILASKGYINGTSATKFSPDGEITRAEIAAFIVRIMSAYDKDADGKFSDVKKSDWFFADVGSAKAIGIMAGTSATTFEPRALIKKDQIMAIAARTLREEMNVKNLNDPEGELKKYTDRKSLPAWGTDDFAIASLWGLVTRRDDGKFNPSATMTRGEVAVVVYKLFELIW